MSRSYAPCKVHIKIILRKTAIKKFYKSQNDEVCKYYQRGENNCNSDCNTCHYLVILSKHYFKLWRLITDAILELANRTVQLISE